ncbi:hypothetical protein G7078_00110 [Sphingomonas sinipercae]|uniref:Lysozyme inhibitor LprI N-terminal domain-containing protein n=1 Tax=Sphingomonas sinipercae TaxID=2714944 RepID=A0A6G7ZK94_9SPHN|nr:hypothetical protein [Sphingomonas sinipercae]QIL01353.1 hypothetical protein G7078_00110 [Sphingomonas sinipercae]
MLAMILAAAGFVAAPSAKADVCSKLTRDFAENEIGYSIMRELDEKVLASNQQYAAATGDTSMMRSATASLTATDSKFKQEGDRITTLLIGHGCTPPDHVTSHLTYRRAIQECATAKGTTLETERCAAVRDAGKPKQ